jgi:hypothetical protein
MYVLKLNTNLLVLYIHIYIQRFALQEAFFSLMVLLSVWKILCIHSPTQMFLSARKLTQVPKKTRG